ncbi:integrase core domain-containing protein [Corynebacterium phoceense]|nr:integrase core domain-containing protein [Corynebacterium phoceense]
MDSIGCRNTSARFAEYAASIDVRLSVGQVGVCWDNAVAESFFSTLKLHLMYAIKQFPTKLEARIRVGEWIETCYNRRRIHTATGQIPAQAMNRFLNPETPAAQADARRYLVPVGRYRVPTGADIGYRG